eukprot:TRINITY_DN35389_c0_g1_i1.p1 TRINITY_DN35389_c0_g1~~TRINITY_DN35389_c0_g1_i1.p1  ORF type:complete len:661 (+),score=197.17 TRINITY_DN35389_c0_g1_i1:49-2031(+)
MLKPLMPPKRLGANININQPEAKRPRQLQPGDGKEFFIEQRLVGWIIGRGGGTLKEIETSFGVKASIDQESKDLGYSKLIIAGTDLSVSKAAEHINTSLSRATAGDAPNGSGSFLHETPPVADQLPNAYEEIQIKQRFVGWLLGKGGGVVKDIEKSSGCKVCINQDSRGLGYSIAQLHGTPEQRMMAKMAIDESIERAREAGAGKPTIEYVEIEQKMVGWLLGKAGGIIKEIEKESGTKIAIDQSTQHLGYSTVQINGLADQVDIARERVVASLEKAGTAPLGASKVAAVQKRSGGGDASGGAHSVQIQVQQQWVGWLVGKAGQAVKDIENSTGAKIAMNQDTKALGHSVCTISGAPGQIAAAYDTMANSLQKVNAGGGGLSPLPAWLRSTVKPALAMPMAVGKGGAGGKGAMSGKGGQGDMQAAVLTLASTLVQNLGPSALSSAMPALQGMLGSQPELAGVLGSLAGAGVAAPPASFGGKGKGGSKGGFGGHPQDFQIEQRYVGWLLGGGGRTIRNIESDTGAKISIDQSTKDQGFSTIKLSGTPQSVASAQSKIQASLNMAQGGGGAQSSGAPAFSQGQLDPNAVQGEMQIEQRFVGWIVGKAGAVLKEIEMMSGTSISIDQTNKAMGYSTVKISGAWTQIAAAQQLITEKVSAAQQS